MARIKLTTDEILKLKAVVLYVIKKCHSIDYFHLFKIIYFADREHYATYGRRIICDTFCALPKGPVPSFLYDAIKVLLNEDKTSKDLNIISNALSANDSVYKFILSAKEDLLHASINVLGTVDYLYGGGQNYMHFEHYNFQAGSLVISEGSVKTDESKYSKVPVATPAPSAPATGNSGEYDEVPKTADMHFNPLWLVGMAVICFVGAYKLREEK